ncbi:MAG: prepilin-type N-terminal cleavage/methylation domain-containing protein [Acidobacteriota bacterium]
MMRFTCAAVRCSAQQPDHAAAVPRRSWRRPLGRAVDRGFTLIELLVVLALIVILASVALAQYKNSVIYAKEAVLKDDLFKMNEAIDQYYADKGQYPNGLESLVSDGYIRAIPVDPFTNSASSWLTVPSEPDPNNPTAQGGIYAVKSGSDGTSIDGKKHSDF